MCRFFETFVCLIFIFPFVVEMVVLTMTYRCGIHYAHNGRSHKSAVCGLCAAMYCGGGRQRDPVSAYCGVIITLPNEILFDGVPENSRSCCCGCGSLML